MNAPSEPPDQPELRVLGVSFRTAPVEVRESLAFDPHECAHFLHDMRRELPEAELQLLSTCNRTEFHLASANADDAISRLLARLCLSRPGARILHEECHRYRHGGDAAVRHLARLASGLDSAILGDAQIHGQLNRARQLAGAAGTMGPNLEQALIHAGRAAARARKETNIRRGAASLGAAVKGIIAHQEARRDSATRVLIVGAGEIARDIGRHLAKGDCRRLTFVNRTYSKGAALARDCGGVAAGWTALTELLGATDIVVSAAACPRPILTRAHFQEFCPELIIDAGMPRNVTDDVPARCLNIDHIREHQDEALAIRRASVPAVEAIIEEELLAWREWRAKRPLERMLKAVFTAIPEISRRMVARRGGDAADAELVRRKLKRELGRHARALRHLDFAEPEAA